MDNGSGFRPRFTPREVARAPQLQSVPSAAKQPRSPSARAAALLSEVGAIPRFARPGRQSQRHDADTSPDSRKAIRFAYRHGAHDFARHRPRKSRLEHGHGPMRPPRCLRRAPAGRARRWQGPRKRTAIPHPVEGKACACAVETPVVEPRQYVPLPRNIWPGTAFQTQRRTTSQGGQPCVS